MKKIIVILSLVLFYSCNEINKIDPFKLVIKDYNYALAYSREFLLTNSELKIIFDGELNGEKDSVIFSKNIQPTEDLKILSEISFGKLKDEYTNSCVEDGSQISFSFTKGIKIKNILLSNYYQKDIGFAINLINNIVPEKHKIDYDKEELLKYQKGCDD